MMVRLASAQRTSVAALSAACAPQLRQVHSSACLLRGIAIGGSGGNADRVSPSSQSSPSMAGHQGRPLFSALREEAKQGRTSPRQASPEQKQQRQHRQQQQQQGQQQSSSARARRASTALHREDVSVASPDVLDFQASTAPFTSAEARKEAITQEKQTPSLSHESSAHHTPAAVATQPPVSQQDSPSWTSLRQRIQTGQAEEAAAVAAETSAKQRSRPSRVVEQQNKQYERLRRPLLDAQAGKKSAAIESIPSWHLSSSGIERAYSFDDALASRMFLQAASSLTLTEQEWVGELSLRRKSNGSESVSITFAGSTAAHDEKNVQGAKSQSRHGNVTEHDVVLAESLDRLAAVVSRQNKRHAKKAAKVNPASETASLPHERLAKSDTTSDAFHPSSASAMASKTTTSALAEDRTVPVSTPKVEQSVPVAVQAEQVPGGHTATESVSIPVADAGTASDLDIYSDEANHGPVDSVLGAERTSNPSPIEDSVPVPNLEHERAGRQVDSGSARDGITVHAAHPGQRSTCTASQSWTSDSSMQQSQKTWAHISSSKDEPVLRIDENVPVEVDGKQVGKRDGEAK